MIKNLKIEFDRNYGIDKRTGWSIVINGSFMAELEKYLFIAVIKTFYRYFCIIDKEYR